ncbi:hypothetical protein AAGG74_17900 [Bacillus mexicanus]|uniref:hypothetical protein n=1 Tax=Bacillus mexicanus TaxID=2834415 RepID=UPI003D21EC28
MLVEFLAGLGIGRIFYLVIFVLIFLIIVAAFAIEINFYSNIAFSFRAFIYFICVVIILALVHMWGSIVQELKNDFPTKYVEGKAYEIKVFDGENECDFESYIKSGAVQKVFNEKYGERIEKEYLDGFFKRVVYNKKEDIKKPVIKELKQVYKNKKIQDVFPYKDTPTYQLILPEKCDSTH